jgi:putative SOS response-associated peptidase YedK
MSEDGTRRDCVGVTFLFWSTSRRHRRLEDEFEPVGDHWPLRTGLVFRLRKDRPVREGIMLRWGLWPHWARDPGSPKPINVKSETVLDRLMFREPFRRPRRLIPATVFYKWQRAGATKRPCPFRRRSDRPLASPACERHGPTPGTGERRLTCSVLTAGANAVMRVTIVC